MIVKIQITTFKKASDNEDIEEMTPLTDREVTEMTIYAETDFSIKLSKYENYGKEFTALIIGEELYITVESAKEIEDQIDKQLNKDFRLN